MSMITITAALQHITVQKTKTKISIAYILYVLSLLHLYCIQYFTKSLMC